MIRIRPRKLPFATSLLLLLLLLLQLLLLATAKVNANANDLKGEESLYSEADNVINADTDNLLRLLKAGPKGKLVQFINIFCGDCRRFAPTFKSVARELYKWQRVLSIYAVDCAQERNVKICRDFHVRHTPTMRYFPPGFTGHWTGLNIATRKPKEIIDQLAGYLVTDMNRNLLHFDPLRSDSNAQTTIEDLRGPGHTEEYVALVLQPKGSNIGRDTILEMLPYPAVAVRLVADAQVFANFGLRPHDQQLAVLDRAGNVQALQAVQESSKAYAASIAEYLARKGRTPLPPLPTTVAPKIKAMQSNEQNAILSTVLRQPSRIYVADLEQAIDKLLHIELPKAELIEGPSLLALRKLITVLKHYNPLNRDGRQLLTSLHRILIDKDRLTGSEFADLVKSQEATLEGNVFKGKRYVGCVASRPFLRGLTCSLWTLFHYLTVAAAKPPYHLEAGYVLAAMHGFVKHFFGCTDCAQHFLAMAEQRRLQSVKDHDQEILWLWEAHNEVNNRLAGDTTEDPKFPKGQFPSAKDCPACRNGNSQWNRTEVLKYLKTIYDHDNWSMYGMPNLRRT